MCLKNRPIDEIYQALFYGHSLITKVFQHFLSLVCSVRNEELFSDSEFSSGWRLRTCRSVSKRH